MNRGPVIRSLASLFFTFLLGCLISVNVSATMTLVDDDGGDLLLGDTVTVTAIVPGSLGGGDFDLWACPDQTILPRDNQPENGDCVGPNIQNQAGDSTTFVLDEDYGGFCNWYIIVHDYPNGGHSNWIGPLLGVDDCDNPLPPGPDSGNTHAAPTLSVWGLALLSMLLMLGAWIQQRRSGRV